MNVYALLAILIPSILGFIVSMSYIGLAIYREREKKKLQVWDTVHDIVLKRVETNELSLQKRDINEIMLQYHYLLETAKVLQGGLGDTLAKEEEERQKAEQEAHRQHYQNQLDEL